MSRSRQPVACFVLALCGLLPWSASKALAQKADTRAQDETALRKVSKDYLAAVERNDRKAMADFWTPSGVYVDENGQTFEVRKLLEGPGDTVNAVRSQTKLTGSTIRFLTADSATEDGTSEVTVPGEKSPVKGRFSAVWVRQGGKWKLDSLRESRIVSEPVAEHLTLLDPFVGEWSGETDDVTIHVSAKWNPGKTYLQRDITVSTKGKVGFTGTQQVGWDPKRGQIRSWVFDGDGGYGEGLWSLEGNMWMVLAKGVHGDGRTSQATHVFKFLSRDSIVWKSLEASVDGQPQRDFQVILARGDKPPAKRPPASPAAATGDAAKRAAILASDTWKRVEAEYKQWSSVQVIYTPEQMEKSNARLRAELEKMSPAELEQFVVDTDKKLKLLMTKDGTEGRAWLGQYLNVMADGYRKKFLGEVPDFASMTSAQMQDEYLKLKSKILTMQQAQAAFDASRSKAVDAQLQNIAEERRAAQAADRARDSAPPNNPFASSYSPRPSTHGQTPPQMQFNQRVGNMWFTIPGSSY